MFEYNDFKSEDDNIGASTGRYILGLTLDTINHLLSLDYGI
jgi:hypothetical protein